MEEWVVYGESNLGKPGWRFESFQIHQYLILHIFCSYYVCKLLNYRDSKLQLYKLQHVKMKVYSDNLEKTDVWIVRIQRSCRH